jgi:hypothetical protein
MRVDDEHERGIVFGCHYWVIGYMVLLFLGLAIH